MENMIGKKKYAGVIDLVLEKSGDKIIASKKYFNGIFKLSPKMDIGSENIPTYFLMQLGGGVVEGEYFKISIDLKENTRGVVTTQAANKVYKCENGLESLQQTVIHLGENSILEYITDPVILYKDAKYKQENKIYMRKSSTLIYTDGITSGWSPDKMKFQYRRARLKTDIYMDGNIVLSDNMIINPRENNIEDLGFMEGYKNFATLIVINDNINEKFIENLKHEIKEFNIDVNVGISSIEVNGFIVRIMGNLTQDLEKIILYCHNYVRKNILDSEDFIVRKL
ncbi:MAG: urease accessory protein UreD [Clostridium perfringens]|nr:urease accessory protein UreD [Clostridium perfringens]